MKIKGNIIYFESDDEFTDFCIAPNATIEYRKDGSSRILNCYSDLYKENVKQGNSFVIRDENSKVYKRGCVSKHVPIRYEGQSCSNRSTLVQLKVQNLESYFGSELYIQNTLLTDLFIDYWDNVVSAWFQCAGSNSITQTDIQKLSNTDQRNAIQEQLVYKNAVKQSRKETKLNFDHMPEPYWGNPKDCSIVILDFNPAGGSKPSKWTSIGLFRNYNSKDSLTYCANKNKYSGMALSFPLLNNNSWISNYNGADWWKKKEVWLNELVHYKGISKPKIPFGMELCGWHSEKWEGIDISSQKICSIIEDRVILPLLYAIDNSQVNFAVCLGAAFDENLFCKYVDNVSDAVYKKIKSKLSVNYKRDKNFNDRLVFTSPSHRTYRIFQIKGTNNYLINTYYRGGNRTPGKVWKVLEKLIIEALS